MNFRQLEYLMEIYHEGGLHKAAEKLYISQPALSQHLQRIEEELGIKIFERGVTPLRPTYAGQHYLEVAENILFQHKQAKIWIEESKLCLHGKLSIGISPARSMQFLPLILPDFRKEYPHIEIELYEEPMFTLQSQISKGILDFALMIAPIFCENLTFLPLIKERFFLAVPPNSPVNTICKKSITESGEILFDELKNEFFVLLHHGGHIRKLADKLFIQKNIVPKIVLETKSADLAFSLCSAGYGLTFTSEMCAFFSNVLSRPNCYPLNEEDFPAWELGIAYHPAHYKTKAMEVFINFTKEKLSNYPFYCG
ncbi:MAG TPA: hypothetical protein DD387_08890 [Lachnoclostridium sp.]|nr:hypothetical protein [Lachnoclostridium sp.]